MDDRNDGVPEVRLRKMLRGLASLPPPGMSKSRAEAMAIAGLVIDNVDVSHHTFKR